MLPLSSSVQTILFEDVLFCIPIHNIDILAGNIVFTPLAACVFHRSLFRETASFQMALKFFRSTVSSEQLWDPLPSEPELFTLLRIASPAVMLFEMMGTQITLQMHRQQSHHIYKASVTSPHLPKFHLILHLSTRICCFPVLLIIDMLLLLLCPFYEPLWSVLVYCLF